MSLDQRSQLFGIHQITAIDPATGVPLGTAKIPGQASLNLSGETIENVGGSSPYPYAVENGQITPELNMTLKEYPNWLWEAFNGVKVTENAAEANGSISSALVNMKGTSLVDTTTGIVSVGVKAGSEADLKSGFYAVEVITATTVHVYALSDLDFGQGTVKEYVDESLKITATPIAILTSGATTEVPGFGIEFTGGSGTIGMTVGDTAVFEVRAANTGSDEVIVGSDTAEYKEIGLILSAQRRSDGELFMIHVFRAKAIGLPIGMTAKEFSQSEMTLKMFKDEKKGGVYKMVRIKKS